MLCIKNGGVESKKEGRLKGGFFGDEGSIGVELGDMDKENFFVIVIL